MLTQETLFTLPLETYTSSGSNFYDVAADGERFLMARAYLGDREVESRYVVVQNFFEELKRLVPN